jgi:hypothetical protein
MKVTVSAVVLAFNRSRFVGEPIESILRQNRAVDEIVVVDDASTDSTQGHGFERHTSNHRRRVWHRHEIVASSHCPHWGDPLQVGPQLIGIEVHRDLDDPGDGLDQGFLSAPESVAPVSVATVSVAFVS